MFFLNYPLNKKRLCKLKHNSNLIYKICNLKLHTLLVGLKLAIFQHHGSSHNSPSRQKRQLHNKRRVYLQKYTSFCTQIPSFYQQTQVTWAKSTDVLLPNCGSMVWSGSAIFSGCFYCILIFLFME